MSADSGLSKISRCLFGDELHQFLAFALIVFRPGAAPPAHPHASSEAPQQVPATWTADEYQLYIDEARLDMARQQADKQDIRARAQIVLTTAILVSGALVASLDGKQNVCLCGILLYAAGAAAIILSGLASGGIISAQSPIGAANIQNLPNYKSGELFRRTADEYAYSRIIGAETAAVLVTVLRDCVLGLVLGVALLGIAHLIA